MRKSAFSVPRDAQHRGGSAYSSTTSNSNGVKSSPGTATPASLNVWARARLLDSTAQILAAQPADPLRVLSVRFSTEAVLATTYPAASATMEENDLEAEACRVIGAPPASGATKSTTLNNGSENQNPSIARNGRSGSVPTVEHLIEESWVRQRLQPYGLHAVARCTCACPPLRLRPAAPSHSAASTSPVGCTEGFDTAPARAVYALSSPLLPQWMDMFALLHRQSRMSNVELAAEAKHWDSEACSATVMPPVDYSAAEETPASVVILCVMAVIEEHLRRAECGGQISGAERPPRLHRRLQISVKLLALQLLAAFMDLQRNDERSQCSRSSSASALDPRQEHDVQESNHDDRSTTVGDTDVCRITRSVYLLTAHQLDELHRWLHCCLHEMIISPFSPYTTGTTAVDGKDGCGSRCGEAGDPIAGSPLAALKSQATAYLTRVLESPAHGMDVPANMLGMVSLNTFVAFMERLAAIVVAHQQTAVAMAISLSARLPPTATASEGEAQLPAWVMENISKCADAVAHQQTALQDGSMPDPIASTVPLVCRVYVNQLSELLAPFQRDVLAHVSREQQEADSPCDTLRKGILCKLQRRLLSWVTQAEHRHAKTQTRLTADSFSPAVVAAEVVSAWVSHVCEAYTVTLYLN